MLILSYKPGHDGGVAVVEDGRLVLSHEGEKDSFPRLEPCHPRLLNQVFEQMPRLPDVVCESGWIKGWDSLEPPVGAGYFGWDEDSVRMREGTQFGRPVRFFASSHERSHLMCAYGLSPYPQGRPVYALVWEGALGDFYLIDERVRVRHLGRAMWEPGSKYGFSYHVADAAPAPLISGDWPGKVMALAAHGRRGAPSPDEAAFIEFMLHRYKWLSVWRDDFAWSPLFRAGVESQAYKDLARKLSDAIFDRFHAFARTHLGDGHPLIIAGGCGLNCEWNSAWRSSGLFDGVFVPPCTNDSGSAIGTAVDAQRALTGLAKIEWTVYTGPEFIDGEAPAAEYDVAPLDFDRAADLLARGAIVAWVQGRCEIGPRALGNRSMLAAPFETATRDRLNRLKRREAYRPIAPVCLEADVEAHFDWRGPSPYMLHFQRVVDARLAAVTHVDGSARVQTVGAGRNAPLERLLEAFKRRTGVGVLCNTSLNFPGRGFINSMADLLRYQRQTGIDALVVHDRMILPRRGAGAEAPCMTFRPA